MKLILSLFIFTVKKGKTDGGSDFRLSGDELCETVVPS
jgi:hypothetical protein